jgi:hypothetical protein
MAKRTGTKQAKRPAKKPAAPKRATAVRARKSAKQAQRPTSLVELLMPGGSGR